MNDPARSARHGATADPMLARSSRGRPRVGRAADSGSFPPLTTPIVAQLAHAASQRTAASAPAPSFPHRLAAPAFGAILSGLLTYCLHQWDAPTAASTRVASARATYAMQGVVAEPVRFELELAPSMKEAAPVERAVPACAASPPAAPRQAQQDTGESTQPLPVVRPIELRLAPETRRSRAPKAAATRAKKNGARGRVSARRPPSPRQRD